MKKVYIFSRTVLIVVVVLFLSGLFNISKSSEPSIQYVATRSDTVRYMLWLADVNDSDVVYDLGSGDGRIVIAAVRDFGVSRAVGIEIDPNLIEESMKNAQKAGFTNKVKFIQGDLFSSDFSEASVVNLFLGHRPNIQLRPKLLAALKPGTRIVSHQFGMGEWQAVKELTVRTVSFGMWGEAESPFIYNLHVPDYTGNESHFGTSNNILMWVVPASVAGIWHGEINTEQGIRELKLILHQRFSEVSGTFELSDSNNLKGNTRVELWGSQIRFWCLPDNILFGQKELIFNGQVVENTMSGKVIMREEGKNKEYEWKAQRDKVDFTGTWEWPCATGDHSVKLHIERDNGKLIAKYQDIFHDKNTILPVTDFYDFGGGFYFTLLIGSTEHGIRITDDTGWLIGEAVWEDGSLTGKMEFYPYGNTNDNPAGAKITEPVINKWKPNLIEK
ncbi:MAG: class I SAM-dependent methyltransferase [Sedimentisphaerales bacterium]|nr:class I SAM-dependent methyltransferase [Sedimentisphaerales bacterium]